MNNAVFSRYLEYCPSSEACKHVWLSFNQLGSVRGEPKLNVTQEFIEIRKQRQIFAKLLGFPTYAHLAMKNKMAGSVENVQSVLSDLLENAKLAHEKEIYELEKFAYSYDFRGSLELWDLPYWSRLYAKQKFDLDELSLVNYFPLSQVLLGLIALCEQLFGIIIEDQPSAECWSSDVRYFRILDEKTKNLLGGFFLDPFAKEGKLIGETDSGWFVAMRPKSKICNSFPLSALIFSFNPPEQDKPSLLYFKDVVNLFDKVRLIGFCFLLLSKTYLFKLS